MEYNLFSIIYLQDIRSQAAKDYVGETDLSSCSWPTLCINILSPPVAKRAKVSVKTGL